MDFLFLLSSERSGSNLITRIFDAHSSYCGPSPSHMIRTFALNRGNYGDLKNHANWMALTDDVAELLNHQLGIWLSGKFSADAIRDNVDEQSLAAIIRYIYSEEARANGKKNVFIKENQVYLFLPYILSEFPQTKFVHLVRDPRDMACSWKLSNNHPGGVRKAVDIWKTDQRNYLNYYWFLYDANKIARISYEDLIENPEHEIRNTCRTLGIPFEHNMLGFFDKETTKANANRIKDWNNLSRPIISTNKKKYPDQLNPVEIKYIEAMCCSEMEQFGYQPDYPLEPVDELENELEAFESAHQPDNSDLNEEEILIRKKRLEMIDKIINRKL